MPVAGALPPVAGLAAALGLGVGDADDAGAPELLHPRTKHSAKSATTDSVRVAFTGYPLVSILLRIIVLRRREDYLSPLTAAVELWRGVVSGSGAAAAFSDLIFSINRFELRSGRARLLL